MLGRLRTYGLFAIITLLFMIMGYVLAGYGMAGNPIQAMVLFGLFAALMNFGMYFFSHKLVLKSYRAKLIERQDNPRLWDIVAKIALRADLPMPQVAIIPMGVPNAFATGPNPKKAVVAATQGILDMLTDDELEGVMAHEMAHVNNRDMLIMTVAATVAGAITFAARMLFWNSLFGGNREQSPAQMLIGVAFMILAPVAALIVQMSISRSREFEADRVGAQFLEGGLGVLGGGVADVVALAVEDHRDARRHAGDRVDEHVLAEGAHGLEERRVGLVGARHVLRHLDDALQELGGVVHAEPLRVLAGLGVEADAEPSAGALGAGGEAVSEAVHGAASGPPPKNPWDRQSY